MNDYYLEVRFVHISAIVVSGMLFFVRGISMGLGHRWTMARPVRFISYGIDTILLVAALMLMTTVRQYPFVDSWLTVKVLALMVYIVLGSFALKRGKTLTARMWYWLAAVIIYVFIISIALTKNPHGFLQYLP